MHKTVVIDIVGLSSNLIGTDTPFIKKFTDQNGLQTIDPVLPAVTTSVQSTYVTGKWPNETGIVGNGWYDKNDSEIKFWKQSNKLVAGEKIWERAKQHDPAFTCAKMFWWYNMYSSADYSATPRPNYLADGRKMPDCYTHPAGLRDELQQELGQFPLFSFWGPGANIRSTEWIADATLYTDKKYDPTLTLVYLPHLDYCLQQYGDDRQQIAPRLREADDVVKKLVSHYEACGARIILLSEYGITPVNRPIHINRLLRSEGLLGIRMERGLELLDAGASKAFAVSDHQVAHIYINDPAVYAKVQLLVSNVPGIAMVLDRERQAEYHIDHDRSGDLVLVAEPDSWFTYYFWTDDALAPDYARVVDIHKKPGYDPVELFMTSKARAAYKLLRKKLGFRYVMDVIPLDATLVKGSHGSVLADRQYYAVFSGNHSRPRQPLAATEVYSEIWNSLVSGQD